MSLPWAPTTLRQSTAVPARGRRPRPRICLRKGCGRKYQPRRLEPALLPGSGMPAAGPSLAGGAAAGQTSPGRRRQSPARPGRTRAPPAGQVHVPDCSESRGYAAAWSRSTNFFSPPLCDRPGCHEPPVRSARNPARYCCPACRQAVRNVQDRERKWLSRGTLDGRKKRAYRVPSRAPAPARAAMQHLRPDTVAGTSGSDDLLRAAPVVNYRVTPGELITLGIPDSLPGAQA